jgi:hypothetical protein
MNCYVSCLGVGTRLLQRYNANLHHQQLHQEPQAPVVAAARHGTRVQSPTLLKQQFQHQHKQRSTAAASMASCYAAAMPASLNSTWSYDFDDVIDIPTVAGLNGGGLTRSSQFLNTGDGSFSSGSIRNSDEYESFGSSESASLPSRDASSVTGSDHSIDSQTLEQHLRSNSSSSSSSAASWLSPSALQQLQESWSQQGTPCCMAGQQCR